MKFYLLNAFKPMLLISSAGITAAIHKYVFGDGEYLIWLFLVAGLDLVTGVAKVWAIEGHKAVTSKGLRMTVLKMIQYGAFLIVTHALVNFTVGGKAVSPFAFINDWAFIILILIEIKSVYENIVIMNPRMDFVNKIIKMIGSYARKLPAPADEKEVGDGK